MFIAYFCIISISVFVNTDTDRYCKYRPIPILAGIVNTGTGTVIDLCLRYTGGQLSVAGYPVSLEHVFPCRAESLHAEYQTVSQRAESLQAPGLTDIQLKRRTRSVQTCVWYIVNE